MCEHFEVAVRVDDPDGGMRHPVEEGGLHHRVMDHVVEDDAVADFQGLGEGEVAHADEVAGQAGAAAQAIDVLAALVGFGGPEDRRFVGHFQAVGHVAGEGDVEHRDLDALVLHDVLHGGGEHAGLPAHGLARLEDYLLQVRVAAAEVLQQPDEVRDVVVGAGDVVPAAHVEPFTLLDEVGELFLRGLQTAFEGIAVVLAEHVEVQPLDAFGQRVGHVVAQDAESRARHGGVVEVGLDFRILGVDAQSEGDLLGEGGGLLAEPVVLPQRVERQVTAVHEELFEIVVGIDGRVGVCLAAHLLGDEPRLVHGAGGGAAKPLVDERERRPEGVALERADDLHAGLFLHEIQQLQVCQQSLLRENVAGGGECIVFHVRYYMG